MTNAEMRLRDRIGWYSIFKNPADLKDKEIVPDIELDEALEQYQDIIKKFPDIFIKYPDVKGIEEKLANEKKRRVESTGGSWRKSKRKSTRKSRKSKRKSTRKSRKR